MPELFENFFDTAFDFVFPPVILRLLHLFIHLQLQGLGVERNKSDKRQEEVGEGGVEQTEEETRKRRRRGRGGVSSHDSGGMSACPWKGHRHLTTNDFFVFLSVCICLTLSAVSSLPLLHTYVLISLALIVPSLLSFVSSFRQTFSF